MRAMGLPAIVTVSRVHVVVARIGREVATLYDPSRPGPETMPFAEYARKFHGTAVVLRPR
jgi:ABC-type bacteriocin/lantibiotic exporter with double-glycine peptidase domain